MAIAKPQKIGKIYGSLEVVEYLGDLKYKCHCECGNDCIVRTTELRNDSRGIFECEECREKKRKNRPLRGEKEGLVFGEVKVIKYLGDAKYLCHCNRCDSDFITRSYNLREGRRGIKTCGCHCIHYSKNEDFFEKIDSEEKAYWLGVVASDGHVNLKNNNVKLTLKYIDYDLVFKFAEALDYDGPIKVEDVETVLPSGEKCKSKIAQVTICSKKLVSSLVKLGFDNHKTYTLDFDFSNIPQELLKHFLRGYFDGDGTCNITRGPSGKICYHVVCTGSTIMMKKIEDIIKKEINGINTEVFPPKKERPWTSVVRVNGKEWFECFNNYLYKDATIYLYRKYKRYKENMVILDIMKNIDKKNKRVSYRNIPIEDKEKLYELRKYKKYLSDCQL